MAIDPVAVGAKSNIVVDYETSYGVAPATPAGVVLPLNSFSLKPSRAKNKAATLTGRYDPAAPFDGNTDVSGAAVVPVDSRALGYWLKAMFGDPTTTGAAAPFTHVFKSNNDMPSLVTQAKYGNFFGQYSGCKVSSFAMNAGGDGELTATINMMGKSADFVDTNYDATAELVTMKRFSNFQGALTSGGTSLGVVTAFSLNMDFGLDNSIRPISGGGYVYDLVQGVMAVTGSLTVFITNKNLLTSAKNSTELEVSLSFTIDANNSLVFKLPQVQLSFDGPTIDGPTGIKMDQNYVAYYNGNADNAAVVVTLKNDIASF